MLRDGTYIRATHLIGLDEIATQSGFEAIQFIKEVGIPVEALSNPDMFISFQALVLLIETVAQRTNRPNLGLEWIEASKPHFHHAGPLKLVSHFVSNGAEWIEVAVKYWKIHTNAFTIETVSDHPDRLKLRLKFASLALPARQFIEASLATIVEMARIVFRRPEMNPICVRFQHAAPKVLDMHEKIFRSPVVFGAEYAEIEFEQIADHELDAVGDLRVVGVSPRQLDQPRVDVDADAGRAVLLSRNDRDAAIARAEIVDDVVLGDAGELEHRIRYRMTGRREMDVRGTGGPVLSEPGGLVFSEADGRVEGPFSRPGHRQGTRQKAKGKREARGHLGR